MASIHVPIGDSGPNKAKDSFIQQAHEARQAREVARRQDKAATIIQAFTRSIRTRKKLKLNACERLASIIAEHPASEPPNLSHSKATDLLNITKMIVFFCDHLKDKPLWTDLIQAIASTIAPPNIPESSVTNQNKIDSSTPPSRSPQEIQTNDEKDLLQDNSLTFDSFVLKEVIKKDENFSQITKLVIRITNFCVSSIDLSDSKAVNFQLIRSCLKVIRAFTNLKNFLDTLSSQNQTEILKRFTSISQSTLKEESFFKNSSALILMLDKCIDDDLRKAIVDEYILIIIGILRTEDIQNILQNPRFHNGLAKVGSFVDTSISILKAPAIIHHLEKLSPEAIKKLNDIRFFELFLKSAKHYIPIKKLNSTSALCVVANLVNLASLNESQIAPNLIDFTTTITKLLSSCKENMIYGSHMAWVDETDPSRLSLKNRRLQKDVFYNPLLGWLTREKEVRIDEKLVEEQLSALWSAKFLKILFDELLTLNRDAISRTTESTDKSQDGIQIETPYTHKGTSPYRQTLLNNISTSISPVGLLRRVVGRRSSVTASSRTSITRNGHNYNPKKCPLLGPEAYRIARVCNMYHTTLDTLCMIKQDILTGICLHPHIVTNLWTYISSLSSHNGLQAFIQLLVVMPRTKTPEYRILILFCECASYLINVLDDSEVYEMQRPFSHGDLIAISSFLNNFLFHILSNNLVGIYPDSHEDPILLKPHKLLRDLHVRECRRRFAPEGHWLIKDLKLTTLLKDIEARKPTALKVLGLMPHIIPHKERVQIFKKFVALDKLVSRPSTLITIHRSRIVEDGYQQLARLSPNALKGLIRVKFINDYGLDEAGIDQDGVFKEFLEDTIKRVFDPALNLFRLTSENCLYPSPTSKLHEDHLSLFKFVGKMLGKAIYEGIVVDVPFALFFLSRVIGQPQNSLYSPLDELPSLDPDLYKSLTYIKHYDGDVSELNLTFSIDQDFMGKLETHDLEPGGKSIPVTRENCVRYIHSVANFHLRSQIDKQSEAFIKGFRSIVDPDWLAMFSASDLQRLISGDTNPIDLNDLRRHTKYFGGFYNNHRVISWLWDVLEKDFTPEEHKLFLKFVTSCSKPPLLGFSNLEPPFSIRCVEVSDDLDLGDTIGSVLRGFLAIRRSDPVDRLPTSSTCFNLLKLPNYQRRSTLREKLRYAIHSNTGFELS